MFANINLGLYIWHQYRRSSGIRIRAAWDGLPVTHKPLTSLSGCGHSHVKQRRPVSPTGAFSLVIHCIESTFFVFFFVGFLTLGFSVRRGEGAPWKREPVKCDCVLSLKAVCGHNEQAKHTHSLKGKTLLKETFSFPPPQCWWRHLVVHYRVEVT